MDRPVQIVIPLTRAAYATLVLVYLAFVPVLSAVGAEDVLVEESAEAEVSEPLFGFLLALSNGDSLGTWTGEDIAAFGEARGRESRFPLETIETIRRRRPTVDESERWPDAELRSLWELKLVENLDRPMPYSILGYHPGSLRVAGLLVLSELYLGDRTFVTQEEEFPSGRPLTGIRALRLDRGWVVLDADRIPDALLGGNLDDAWTLGFVVAQEGDRQVGLAVSIKRDEDSIFGEFDFVEDKIMRSGSPLGYAVTEYCRYWFARPGSNPPPTWREE